MKRSAIKPGAKSLERGSTFARPQSETKSKRVEKLHARGERKAAKQLKRGRRTLTPGQRQQAAGFKASVQGRPCARCGKKRVEMEAHHGIEASYLRRHHPEHVYDRRNAVPLCPWWIDAACHGDHTSRMRPLRRDQLPESVEMFAAELGLEWMLERNYA